MATGEKNKLLHQLVRQVRATEAVLLERSRQNLLLMKSTLAAGRGIHLAPCVLSTFSVSLVVTGTLLNACMGSSRLFIHNIDLAHDLVNRLVNADGEAFRNVVSWRTEQAGVPVPWLEQQLAEIQAILEMCEEQQRSIVSPHLLTTNKIMEISGMLASSERSLVVAVWAYITNSFTVTFAQNMTVDLVDAIDQFPESYKKLTSYQNAARLKIAEISEAITAFTLNGKCPDNVVFTGGVAKERADSRNSGARESLIHYENQLLLLRSCSLERDRSMAAIGKALPNFVRSLLEFVAIWNKEFPHLARPD